VHNQWFGNFFNFTGKNYNHVKLLNLKFFTKLSATILRQSFRDETAWFQGNFVSNGN